MTIREATHDDIECLIELRFAFLRDFRHISESTCEALLPQLRRYFSEHIGAGDFIALLGEEDGQTVCTAFFTVSESPPNDQYINGKIAYVFNVFTPPKHRGNGYATKLITKLIETAKTMDIGAINLNASKAGQPLYQKLGFDVIDHTAMRLQLGI